MNVLMTVTSKGQVTLPLLIRRVLGVNKGDRVVAVVSPTRVFLEPAGRGVLDFVGKMGKLKIPRGKTVNDLIQEATLEYAEKSLR